VIVFCQPRYCDGSSFTGDVHHPIIVDGKPIFLRYILCPRAAFHCLSLNVLIPQGATSVGPLTQSFSAVVPCTQRDTRIDCWLLWYTSPFRALCGAALILLRVSVMGVWQLVDCPSCCMANEFGTSSLTLQL
jgi:hypothetical protein